MRLSVGAARIPWQQEHGSAGMTRHACVGMPAASSQLTGTTPAGACPAAARPPKGACTFPVLSFAPGTPSCTHNVMQPRQRPPLTCRPGCACGTSSARLAARARRSCFAGRALGPARACIGRHRGQSRVVVRHAAWKRRALSGGAPTAGATSPSIGVHHQQGALQGNWHKALTPLVRSS